MKTNIYTTAVSLSDPQLLARTQSLARTEQEACAELVAHLAVLETRPSAYAALGYGSLFDYCTRVLRLSEDAACTRIAAARWCREFPVIADLMAAGSLSLTAVRLLGPHLTSANHESVLARASNKLCKDVEVLVAELAPQPDRVASVRKLPSPKAIQAMAPEPSPAPDLWTTVANEIERETPVPDPAAPRGAEQPIPLSPPTGAVPAAHPRPPLAIVKPSAPERYRVQFTLGQGAHDELRRVQALLRREIPAGDPGLIFERALHLLLEKVEKEKLGAGRVREGRNGGTQKDERPNGERPVIRLETDKRGGDVPAPRERSRYVPGAVRTAVWTRDGGQCAFRGPSGVRCGERSCLEFHHRQPFAHKGPTDVGNIALRCRRHNQYEGELDFGVRDQ